MRKLTARLRIVGFTQKEFAEALGVNPATVSRWHESMPAYAESYLDLLEHNAKCKRRLVALDAYRRYLIKMRDVLNAIDVEGVTDE